MHDDEATPARAWLTVEEAARIAGVHRYSVYKWIRWGWLAPLPADDGRFRVRC
jgi:predicted site-specific integrase-resolvase